MAPATCNREPRPPRPDPDRRWIGLGFEASGMVAGSALVGWWLRSVTGSELLLVLSCLAGVAAAVWLLIRASA